jgi:hypothetical protein
MVSPWDIKASVAVRRTGVEPGDLVVELFKDVFGMLDPRLSAYSFVKGCQCTP